MRKNNIDNENMYNNKPIKLKLTRVKFHINAYKWSPFIHLLSRLLEEIRRSPSTKSRHEQVDALIVDYLEITIAT